MTHEKDDDGGKKIPVDGPPFDPDVPGVHPKIDPGDPGYDPDDPQHWGEKDKPPFGKSPPKPKPKPGPHVDPFPWKDD